MTDTKVTCTVYVNGQELIEWKFNRVSLDALRIQQNIFRIVQLRPGDRCIVVYSGNIRGLHTIEHSDKMQEKKYQHNRETPDPYVITVHTEVLKDDPIIALRLCHPDEDDYDFITIQFRAILD